MAAIEAFLDGEWESLSKLFSCEDSDIHLHFNGCDLLSNNDLIPSDFLAADQDVAGVDKSLFLPSDDFNASFYYASQESSTSSDIESAAFSTSSGDQNHLATATNSVSFLHATDNAFQSTNSAAENDSSIAPVFPDDDLMEEILQLKAQIGNEMQLKRKRETPSNAIQSSDQSPKRRPGVNKRNSQSGKSTNEEEDSESSKVSKAGKGPATDPQSLYARKRRERINERLKILQSLVPNGTKVDISTMLEEAVHYVKFLQIQIKLLSSDDTWMYAPIAYNGMDIGLYQKMLS